MSWVHLPRQRSSLTEDARPNCHRCESLPFMFGTQPAISGDSRRQPDERFSLLLRNLFRDFYIQKNQFNTELVSACPATSYSHRGVSPNYHRR